MSKAKVTPSAASRPGIASCAVQPVEVGLAARQLDVELPHVARTERAGTARAFLDVSGHAKTSRAARPEFWDRYRCPSGRIRASLIDSETRAAQRPSDRGQCLLEVAAHAFALAVPAANWASIRVMLHGFDRLLARRALAFTAIAIAIAIGVTVTTDEPYSTFRTRVARLCAFVPALSAIGAAITLAQSRARGELRALEALGVAPFRMGRGPMVTSWALGFLAARGAGFPAVRPELAVSRAGARQRTGWSTPERFSIR